MPKRPRLIRSSVVGSVASAAIAAWVTAAMAVSASGDPPAAPSSPTAPPGPRAVEPPPPQPPPPLELLEEKPTELDGIGVSLRVPKGATVARLANSTAYRIDDARDAPRYLVRAQSMVASTATSSPGEQFEQHLRYLVEKGQEYKVLRDVDLIVEGSRAKLAYLSSPMGEGVTAVQGWLIIQTGPNTFVVFTVMSSGVDFAEADDLLAASFSTISLKSLENAANVQAEKLERTKRFLATLTPKKLKSVADGKARWYRIYRPGGGSGGSDLEIGFLRIRAFEAERGEISSDVKNHAVAAPEQGLLVEVIAKLLVDGDPGHRVDIQSRYWEAWDRQSESWATLSTERKGPTTSTWGQTAWRNRGPSTNEHGSLLYVVNTKPRQAVNNDDQMHTRNESEWEVPEEYLNQAEVILLGSLLPRDGSLEGDFSFYWYDGRANKLPQRIDRWTREADGSGRHVLLSRPSSDAAEMKQLFGPDGERIRRIDADGLHTEAIEHADLLRIWKSKGLPTG